MKTMSMSVHLFLAECTYAPKRCGFKPFAVYRVFLRFLHCGGFFSPNSLQAVIVTGQNPGLSIAIFRIGICLMYNTYLDYSMVMKR